MPATDVTQLVAAGSSAEPLPANITSVQPGGGVCCHVELAWGRLRRMYLRRFRPGYIKRMAELREGDALGCPHDVLDPRDLKFYRPLCTAAWNEADDPFAWRGRLGFAHWGLAELQLIGWPLAAVTAIVAIGFWQTIWAWLAVVPGVLTALVVWFFRDPPRAVPQAEGLLVSPADGVISEVTQLAHDEFVGGPAVRIGIFLSIFNVHVNRSPCAARVIRLRYSPGEFLNATKPESALRNENMWIGLEEASAPFRRLVVRQIAGMYARRIVCDLRSGEAIPRGHKFGMIKLGSRTELILPADAIDVRTTVGQRVWAGASVLAQWAGDRGGPGARG